MSTLSENLLLTALTIIAMASAGYAQDLEPRAYVNTPVGMNFLIAGYGFTDGGVATDPAVPLENAKIQAHGAVIGYARALDIWGKSGKFDVIVPYAWTSGHAEFMGESVDSSVSGFADPRFRLSVNFFGAPALSPEQFANYRQDLIIGATLQVTPPLGQYDGNKLLNIGSNRWSIRPELGISKALGSLTLELATDATIYTDNDKFARGRHLEQDPMYSVQGHVVYRFQSGIWTAIDGNYYWGGRTTINGVRGNNLQQNSRGGITLALPVNRHNSIKVYGSTGVSTRTGSDFNAIGMSWQYRWGGGL